MSQISGTAAATFEIAGFGFSGSVAWPQPEQWYVPMTPPRPAAGHKTIVEITSDGAFTIKDVPNG